MTHSPHPERSDAKSRAAPLQQAARTKQPESRGARQSGATILVLPRDPGRRAAHRDARAQAGQTEQEAQLLGEYNLYNG